MKRRLLIAGFAALPLPALAQQSRSLPGRPPPPAGTRQGNAERSPQPAALTDQDRADLARIETYLDGVRKSGSSCGAVIEVVASGVPTGLGAPIYGKLDADLAAAMMSINAVKGVEIGDGFAAAALSGEENADEMQSTNHGLGFSSNHAGGILGGISTGQDIVARMAFKPTSSLPQPLLTIDDEGNETEIATKGRHDPCVGIRGVPVAEAMMALTLCDHWLRHKAQCL